MIFTREQQTVMLHDAARAANMDGHVTSTPPSTMAERAMTWWGGRKNTPRKNSYLYCDSVDACFFYTADGTPTVTITRRRSDRHGGKYATNYAACARCGKICYRVRFHREKPKEDKAQ